MPLGNDHKRPFSTARLGGHEGGIHSGRSPDRLPGHFGPRDTGAEQAGRVIGGKHHAGRGRRRTTARTFQPGGPMVRAFRLASADSITFGLGSPCPQRLHGLPRGELRRAHVLHEHAARQLAGVLHGPQHGIERREASRHAGRKGNIARDDVMTP